MNSAPCGTPTAARLIKAKRRLERMKDNLVTAITGGMGSGFRLQKGGLELRLNSPMSRRHGDGSTNLD